MRGGDGSTATGEDNINVVFSSSVIVFAFPLRICFVVLILLYYVVVV